MRPSHNAIRLNLVSISMCASLQPAALLEAEKRALVIALLQREGTAAAADVARVVATATANATFNAAMQRKQAMLREARRESRATPKHQASATAVGTERELSLSVPHLEMEASQGSGNLSGLKGTVVQVQRADTRNGHALSKAPRAVKEGGPVTWPLSEVTALLPDNQEGGLAAGLIADMESKRCETYKSRLLYAQKDIGVATVCLTQHRLDVSS